MTVTKMFNFVNLIRSGGFMNPFKTRSSLARALLLMLLAVMAFAGNAAARCNITLYIQLPENWSNNFAVFERGNNSWHPYTYSVGPNGFFEIDMSSHSGNNNNNFVIARNNNAWDGNTIIGPGGIRTGRPDNGEAFACPNNGQAYYLVVQPSGSVYFDRDPPNAYYLYFYPPSGDNWLMGKPVILTYNGTTLESKKTMEADSKCGWYKAVYFGENDLPPDESRDTYIVYNESAPISEYMGFNGTKEIDAYPTSINFKKVFENNGNMVYFVADGDDAGILWHSIDPPIAEDVGRCSYKLAAFIYDTHSSTNTSFREGGTGSGINTGLVKSDLDANGKMVWNNKGTPLDDWTETNFNKAFRCTEGSNAMICYDMPFARDADGLWTFDSNYLCNNGELDLDGDCSGKGDRAMGFFPNRLNASGLRGVDETPPLGPALGLGSCTYDKCTGYSSGNPANSGCSANAEIGTFAPMKDSVNMHCYDRGLTAGTGGTSTACGAPYSDGHFNNGDNPGIWNWGARDNLRFPGTSSAKRSNGNPFFCFESHSKFVYQPGQEFFFRGDDDIWVFINNELVIDLGGTHLASPGFVKLDSIGRTGTRWQYKGGRSANGQATPLEKDKQYPISIFFCDRRTDMSNVRISTNMYIGTKSGWSLDGNPKGNTGATICLTTETEGASCAAAAAGGSSEGPKTQCGSELKGQIKYQLQHTGVTVYELDPVNNSAYCSGTEDDFECYGGIYIKNGVVRVATNKLAGLPSGRYIVQAVTTLVALPGGKALDITTFSITPTVSVVWGEAYRDGGGTDLRTDRIRSNIDLGTQNKTIVAGQLRAIGFAKGNYMGDNRFEVEMDPNIPPPTFNIAETSFIGNKDGAPVEGSGLIFFTGPEGTDDQRIANPAQPFTIPNDDNRLLILWVTATPEAEDDAVYTINTTGSKEAAILNAKLPRVKFIENAATPTILPPKQWQTKGTDLSKRKDGEHTPAKDMWAYMGEQMTRTVAIYDYHKGEDVICTDCDNLIDFKLQRSIWAGNEIYEERKTNLGVNNYIAAMSIGKLNGGIAGVSFVGMRELLHEDNNYGFLTIGGVSKNTAASWDSLLFTEPPVPYPVSAKIYDRNGDGIGDELRIEYNKCFVYQEGWCPGSGAGDGKWYNPDKGIPPFIDGDSTKPRRDSMPNYIQVIWDLERSEIIKFGGDATTNADCQDKSEEIRKAYWKQQDAYIDPQDASVIVLKGQFSEEIKTSVGSSPDSILVRSWSSFHNEKDECVNDLSNIAFIQDRIPPIVRSAKYEPDERGNCAASSSPGCRDKVQITLSEPVVVTMPEGTGDRDRLVKAAFAYKLRSIYGDSSAITGELTKFNVYNTNRDLPQTQTWSPSSRGLPIASGTDSIVNFTFKSYKVGGDTTQTPVAGDSVKLASSVHENFAAPYMLRDMAIEEDMDGNVIFHGNEANPAEIGKRIEGVNRSAATPMHIAELDPTDNALNRALDSLGFDTTKIFRPGNPIEFLPIPDNWMGQSLSDNIRMYYPSSVGMVFIQDIDNIVSNEIESKYNIKVKPENIKFYAQTFYHTNIGDFVVNRKLPSITCADDIFKVDVAGQYDDCRSNSNNIYVAWNLKDAKSRFVGVGAYVGIYDFYWTVTFENPDKNGAEETLTFGKTERKTQMHGVKRIKKKK
jgi:fibro-slime domain-containing protein